jgi:integrase
MRASVYKICGCKDRLKCRHPWWFSYKRRGSTFRLRKSLDVVLERHVDSKTIAETEAQRLRAGIVATLADPASDALTARTRELLGLPPAPARSLLKALTVRQLLDTYHERHLSRTATSARQKYQIGIVGRTAIVRPDGTTAPLGEWLAGDVTADTIERLREARTSAGVHVHEGRKGSNRVGGIVATNRDLRLLRAAFNWAVRTGYVERTPFKVNGEPAVRLSAERARSRRLQAGEAERLLEGCKGSHLRALVEAALETGMRKGELLGLQWSQVQLADKPEIWLPAGKTKTGRARRVPVSARLKTILEMRRDALRATMELQPDDTLPGTLYVFGNEIGQKIGGIKTAWRLACARGQLDDLHFHDLRREAGSRWLEGGVPLHTIRDWLGHTNISQTSTYLSSTMAGGHDAMKRFEERTGRLTPIDTEGETPPPNQARTDTTADNKPQQNTVRH